MENDDIDYISLMQRLEKFYDYKMDNYDHDIRIKYAKDIIQSWIDSDLVKQLGSPKNPYEMMIQLDLRGY